MFNDLVFKEMKCHRASRHIPSFVRAHNVALRSSSQFIGVAPDRTPKVSEGSLFVNGLSRNLGMSIQKVRTVNTPKCWIPEMAFLILFQLTLGPVQGNFFSKLFFGYFLRLGNPRSYRKSSTPQLQTIPNPCRHFNCRNHGRMTARLVDAPFDSARSGDMRTWEGDSGDHDVGE